ncbi:MAG TPA: FAD-dependent thymidylate synthase [Alphaproteobacteria bacterium]|nr:FAD-dependent thymidylate synthase [Alphaproteobacteria bacterium]
MPPKEEEKAEIAAERAAQEPTRRAVAPGLEAILYEAIPVLDHGFIRVVDYMGDDAAIVQAARVSYGHGTKRVSEDKGLIHYLMRHKHTTPFEMCEIKYHVKLPIFVARQWIRHRTANVNEYSARYSILDNEFYIPDRDYLMSRRLERQIEHDLAYGQPDLFGKPELPHPRHLAAQSQTNRQGREGILSLEEASDVLEWIKEESAREYTIYTKLLNENPDGTVVDPNRQGIARELARMVLPANIYTQWYWKIDLHNLFHFIALRADPHAQYEIRAYAEAIAETVKRWVPIAYEAFAEHGLGGVHLSAKGLAVVKRLLAGEAVIQESSGLSKREWRELMEVFGRES